MSTYLQICQDVARESGTFSDLTTPSTVTGQTGRLLRLVNWVNLAYKQIQARRNDWSWLRGEFSGATIAGVRRYTLPNLDSSVTRFRSWIIDTARNAEPSISIYLPADGQSTERWLIPMDWDVFRKLYLVGSAATTQDYPSHCAIDPSNQLVLHAIPDAAYTVSGEYMKSPQNLAADDDTPEMPATHHPLIQWEALKLMGIYDEAVEQNPFWEQQADFHMKQLIASQTPRIRLGGPLA